MKSILCKIKGHDLIDLNGESAIIKEYKCKKCQQKFTTDGYGKIVRLTFYWEQNNLIFKNNKNYHY